MLANPASQNCIDKGGTLSIEKNGKGDQFGVCNFPDNLQCEEWAMMRGACRNGGIKVTGYVTPAARYCAITGGGYHVTAASNTAAERGTCTFADGKRCGAEAYFNGACSAQNATPAKASAAASARAEPKSIRARFTCSGGKTIAATFVNGAQSSVKLVLSDGRTLSLPQGLSGSGARYTNSDESVVFWNKGDTATLEESGKTTFDGCVAKP
jgi:putative hemolysin